MFLTFAMRVLVTVETIVASSVAMCAMILTILHET